MTKNSTRYSASSVNLAYASLVEAVLELGMDGMDRTGVGTKSFFGEYAHYNMKEVEEGKYIVPIITLKKVHLPSVVHELLWMLSGSTNVKYLQDNGVRIWNEWADENGELGPVYGSQWRNFGDLGCDQIKSLEKSLRDNPRGRRHILSAWNPAEVDRMALPPCHMFAQFYVDGKQRLHCQMYQRSADLFLGVPFNVLQYSLLTVMLARVLGYGVGSFKHVLGDLHVYHNHIDLAYNMLDRDFKSLESGTPLEMPTLTLPKRDSILDYTFEDFVWGDYVHHPHMAAKVAV